MERKKKKIRIVVLVFCLLFVFLAVSFIVASKAVTPYFNLLNLKKLILARHPRFYEAVFQMIQDNNQEVSSVVEKLQLPLFKLSLSRQDIAHFSDLVQKLKERENEEAIVYYQDNNNWRNAELEYNGEKYKIKIKAHGLDPSGHQAGKYISFAIKLSGEKEINQATRFSLIISDRIRDKRLLVFDLAKRFNVLIQPIKPVRVKINGWEEKVYYFEYQLDNKYLETIDQASWQIYEGTKYDNKIRYNHKSSIIGYEEEFNPGEYYNYFSNIFSAAKLVLPTGHQEAIYKRYLDLNLAIDRGEYQKIDQFFDMDYIASYLAARTILGETGHGAADINFYIFLDTASGKFYPAFTRDNIPSALPLIEGGTLEEELNYWSHLERRQRLFDLLDQNDLARQAKYQKIYEFISENGETIGDYHEQIIENDNKMHYFGWFKLLLNRLGLSIDEIPTRHNVEVLKSYLLKSEPQIAVLASKNQLALEILPQSMSAIRFSELTLSQPSSSGASEEKVGVTLITKVEEEVKEVVKNEYKVLRDEQGIHLTQATGELQFSTALGKKAEKVNRKYILTFDFEPKIVLGDPRENLRLGFQNVISQKEIERQNLTLTYKDKITDEAFREVELEKVVNDCLSWSQEHRDLKIACTSSGELIIQRGRYSTSEDLILPRDYKLILEAGTTLLLGENNILVAWQGLEVRGTKEQPVVISALDPGKPFGSVGILGDKNTLSVINYLHLSGGSERWFKGTYFSAGLSLHYNGEVRLANSEITENHADDGINIKYSNKAVIEDSVFQANAVDQIDLDYASGLVKNSKFSNEKSSDLNGDGLDISGSKILAKNNIFNQFKDKAISVGEGSRALIYNNVFEGNNVAVAVKDLAKAYFIDNQYNENQLDINAYEKKAIWGPGEVYVLTSGQKNNDLRYTLDEKSTLKFFPSEITARALNLDSDDSSLEEIFNYLETFNFLEN